MILGSSRRQCAFFDEELVEFFQEYDDAVDGIQPRSLEEPSTEAVVEEVELSTMLAGHEDDSNELTWKDILIT